MSLTNSDHLRDLLFQDNLDKDQLYQRLADIGFVDQQAAYLCLRRIPENERSRSLLAEVLPFLFNALTRVTHPNQVLINFERLAHNVPQQATFFQYLVQNSRRVELLVKLFTGSQYLTEILLREPSYFERLTAHHDSSPPKPCVEFETDAQAILNGLEVTDSPDKIEATLTALHKFQRWELLRIGTADLLGSYDLPSVTRQLSNLSDSVVEACLHVAARQTGIPADGFVVIALGKLGGEELNYSSDIDLLFLCEHEANQYVRLGQRLIDYLSQITAEGFFYRVDMRLRPWGRSGPLVSSLSTYAAYVEKEARLWEKQALLKARPVAGNKLMGQHLLQQLQPLLFNTPPEQVRADVHALKQKIEAQLQRRGQGWGEVKLGEGSIRDIEFITQYLQLAHGKRTPQVRHHNTLQALQALFTHKYLDPAAYRVLVDGYTFLRTIEHHLQLMHYRQTHQLPRDGIALTHLAQRLGFEGQNIGNRFLSHYEQHSTVIRLLYQQQFVTPQTASSVITDAATPTASSAHDVPPPNLLHHLVRLHPSYLSAFSRPEIEQHARLMLQLSSDMPIVLEAQPLDNRPDNLWKVIIVGYDTVGLLSVVCGLMMVHDFNIISGDAFSYGADMEQPAPPKKPSHRRAKRKRPTSTSKLRKIVDVFIVSHPSTERVADAWASYLHDLTSLVKLLRQGHSRQVQGKLAKKVAWLLKKPDNLAQDDRLAPIDIVIDNDSAKRHTILQIDAPDTIGFLYAFANALTFANVNIRRVTVETSGHRVRDVLYVTDSLYRKIKTPEKLLQLRVAVVLIKQFTYLLPTSPNPESALLHFREFIQHLFTRPNWPSELASLERPEVMQTLARLLGMSDFLWAEFLRMQHENLFPVLANVADLANSQSKESLRDALATILQQTANQQKRQALNAFKDRQMFRIDMRHIQGHISQIDQFSTELTDLAEVVIDAAYQLSLRQLQPYGIPHTASYRQAPLTICALGKCGGRELGFASDIELMFIFDGKGRSSGPRVITTAEYFNKLVFAVNDWVQAKRKGIFELDLRLRPYGNAGHMAVSLDSFKRYFAPEGDAWPYERQALIRLRPIAGDQTLAHEILHLRDQFVYTGQPFDVGAMRAMRERQLRHSVTAGTINAKLSWGGLVDIEYLVQGLQITHGHLSSALRSPNTAQALLALTEAGFIEGADYQALLAAFRFLRQLINALRIAHGNATDITVPSQGSDAFAYLARRLNYRRKNIIQLQHDLTHHMAQVQAINQRLLGS